MYVLWCTIFVYDSFLSSRSSMYGQGPTTGYKKDPRPLSDKCKREKGRERERERERGGGRERERRAPCKRGEES